MPIFDLGRLVVTQYMSAPLERSYEVSKQVLESYKKSGFQVLFTRQTPHKELAATFTNTDGTRINAAVKLREQGQTRTEVTIELNGKVHVGGFKGAFANDDKVNKAAKEMLIKAVKEALKANGLDGAMGTILQREAYYQKAQHDHRLA